MSKNTIVLNNGQQAIINFDISKIFVYDNQYEQGELVNSEYEEVTFEAGTLLGRVAATGQLVPHDAGAADGSQYPVGVLAQPYTVAEGATQNVFFCVKGDVVKDKVVLGEGDTFETIIEGKQLKDRIGSDTVGIKLVVSDQLTEFDNQ